MFFSSLTVPFDPMKVKSHSQTAIKPGRSSACEKKRDSEVAQTAVVVDRLGSDGVPPRCVKFDEYLVGHVAQEGRLATLATRQASELKPIRVFTRGDPLEVMAVGSIYFGGRVSEPVLARRKKRNRSADAGKLIDAPCHCNLEVFGMGIVIAIAQSVFQCHQSPILSLICYCSFFFSVERFFYIVLY